ncbi:MAG: ATP-binding protein [Nitrospirota bacterium]
MKEYRHSIFNSLAFRVIVPVLIIVTITGFGLYALVLRSVAQFADRQIKEIFLENSHSIYLICDRNMNELLRSGMANSEKSVHIKKALATKEISAFMNHTGLQCTITENRKRVVCQCELPAGLPELVQKSIKENTLLSLEHKGKRYYAYMMKFEPWDWQIILVKDAAQYGALIREVRLVYTVTGLTLLAAALMLIYHLNSTIKRPINAIITPLKKGERPAYTGNIEEFAFISESIGQMIASLQEQTERIKKIYHIAITHRGEEFFDEIAVAVGTMFGMNSLIAKINPNGNTAVIVARYFNGTLEKNITISLKGTPCEGVCTKRQMVVVSRQAYKEFPCAPMLNNTQAESYIGFPVFDRKGEVSGIVNAFGQHREFSESDITLLQTIGQMVAAEFEFLEKEESQQRLMKEVIQEQKLKSINVLVGGVAHNFNNMLVGVLGYASLMNMKLQQARGSNTPVQGELLDELLRHTESIETAAQRAQGLATELGILSRGTLLEEKTSYSLSLNAFLTKFRDLLAHTFPKTISIVTELADDLALIKGDISQIEQAILNICINSKDAMPEGGTLRITTANLRVAESDSRHPYLAPGSYVTITITDTGTGIDEETLSHIFEPFFTTKPVDKGTGLGLATAYAIIKVHGGHIAVESTPGKGTTCTIHLPAL